jgi:hypothetical protein
MTGVSGGSVGIALFAADLRRRTLKASGQNCAVGELPTEDQPIATALSFDLMLPLAQGLLYSDLLQRFSPVSFPSLDRARYLEDALANAWFASTKSRERIGDISFQEAWQGPEGAIPALMLLTTSVETGHRMAISHVMMQNWPRIGLCTLSDIARETDLPLHAAALLSARFPLVTPHGTLQTPDAKRCYIDGTTNRRYVDGGYFENSGLTTLLDVIEVIRNNIEDRNKVRLVVIRVENSRATTRKRSISDGFPSPEFPELSSPLRAMLNTRQARGELAEISLTRTLRDIKKSGILVEEITFALEPGDVPIPLGWALSESARQNIRRQLGSPGKCGETTASMNSCAQARVLHLLDTK